MHIEKNEASAKSPVQTKRPYHAPLLSEYGDIRQITQTHVSGTRADGGGKGANKTG